MYHRRKLISLQRTQFSQLDKIPFHDPHWGPLTKNAVGYSLNLTECASGSEFIVCYEQGFAIRQILTVLCQNSNETKELHAAES